MFPTEIVDYFFSLLHADQDYVTLEICSAVFPQIVDRHLYSQITLRSPAEDVQLSSTTTLHKGTFVVHPTKFSDILTQRPYVANYVRSVRIFIEGLTSLPAVSSILPNLPRIESITLISSGKLGWNTLGSEFCAAFRNSVRLPSVKEVVIDNTCGFPLDAFDDCENLRNLVLYGEFEGQGVFTLSYPRLSSLHVDSRPDFSRMVSWMKSNTVHTLSLHIISCWDIPKLQPLIEACSTTLVNMDVFHAYTSLSTPHSEFPVLQLPLLEHLTFRSPVMVPGAGMYLSTLPLLVPFVRSIQNISEQYPIRLTLRLQFKFYVGASSPLRLDWSSVAAILVLPVFRSPIKLYIDFIEPEIRGPLPSDIASSFEQNCGMKKLLEDGKLILIKGD